ncbi:hypothetical protein JL107_04185 [Nakamurella flavida]|uniref:Uncharacterized protein n=1 Tax=Nakamurella flavida TaxID=363630 RepID=A0A938YDF9_9ACTN|nr:hypothetical protein [Nakamurella flavida]MBM9475640.1 hypothetical protein [Nakamurella flavida]MDP9778084.1 hypothetical protein [Nakamurella flavida]
MVVLPRPARTGTPTSPGAAGSAGTVTKWIYSLRTDQLLAWSWLPLFALTAGLSLPSTPTFDRATLAVMSWVFLVSLLHQPLTLLLVYGDKAQFRMRRALFVWTPIVAIPLITAAVLLDLWIIIPIAAVWQLYHTQQQRYGLLRIYARKAKYGSVALDRAVSYVPLAAVIAAVALLPGTAHQLTRFADGLGSDNASEVELLLSARSLLLWVAVPLAVAAVVVLLAYGRQERQAVIAGRANPAKWNYLASSLALLVALMVNPVAGLVAYITAHAIEYVVVVHRTLISRYGTDARGAGGRGLLAFLAGTPLKRVALLVGFFAVFAVIDLQMRGVLPTATYLIIVYSIGLLHFLYDGFIWKSRKPAVASDFGIPATPPAR